MNKKLEEILRKNHDSDCCCAELPEEYLWYLSEGCFLKKLEEAFSAGQESVERHRLIEAHPAHCCNANNCERYRILESMKREAEQKGRQEVFDAFEKKLFKQRPPAIEIRESIFYRVDDYKKLKEKFGVK